MQHTAYLILYMIFTAMAVVLALGDSRPADNGFPVASVEDFSAVDVALLASGVARAIDVVAVDLLCRGVLKVERGPGRLHRDVIVAGPNPAEGGDEPIPEILSGIPLTRGGLLRILRPGILRERDGLVARGLVRSGRDAITTVVRRSYPIVLSSGLGVVLLALHPGFWPDKAIGGCLAIELAVLLVVNTSVRLTGSGEATLLAIRRHHADRTRDGPSQLTYDVALWGLERLGATAYEGYLVMKIHDDEIAPST